MTARTPGQQLDEVIASTKQEYDEAKLKLHLANMELNEEWNKLETRWVDFCDKCKRADEAAEESEAKIDDALHAVGLELQQAFQNIKIACS